MGRTISCLFAMQIVGVIAGCGQEKPAEAPRMIEQTISEPAPPPIKNAAKVDAGAPRVEEVEEEEIEPTFADAPARPLGAEEIHVLVRSLPLTRDAIRFEAIDRFLVLYAPFTSNKALLRQTRKAFRAARNCMKTPLSAFSLSSDLRETATFLKDPPGRYYFPFVAALTAGVASTKNVILDFYEQVRDTQLSAADESAIRRQIGRDSTDTSLASRNLDVLHTMQTSVTAE